MTYSKNCEGPLHLQWRQLADVTDFSTDAINNSDRTNGAIVQNQQFCNVDPITIKKLQVELINICVQSLAYNNSVQLFGQFGQRNIAAEKYFSEISVKFLIPFLQRLVKIQHSSS